MPEFFPPGRDDPIYATQGNPPAGLSPLFELLWKAAVRDMVIGYTDRGGVGWKLYIRLRRADGNEKDYYFDLPKDGQGIGEAIRDAALQIMRCPWLAPPNQRIAQVHDERDLPADFDAIYKNAYRREGNA